MPGIVLLAAAANIATASPHSKPERDAACRAAIAQVREAVGQPRLERSTAKSGEPLLIAAVDKRIDKCRVLTMARDHRDIRPEPGPADGAALLLPAR